MTRRRMENPYFCGHPLLASVLTATAADTLESRLCNWIYLAHAVVQAYLTPPSDMGLNWESGESRIRKK